MFKHKSHDDWSFEPSKKSIIDVSLCITHCTKYLTKKFSVEDRTQLTTTAKSCISDGQLKTLLSTIHQTPIIFYLSCLFFEWEIHEDGNGATTKKGDKDMSKVYIQTESMYILYDEFPLFLMLVCTKKSVMHMHIFIANKLMRNSKVRSNYWILFQSTDSTNNINKCTWFWNFQYNIFIYFEFLKEKIIMILYVIRFFLSSSPTLSNVFFFYFLT